MIFLLITSGLLNLVLLYGAWNSVRKIETLEDAISIFYSRLERTLQAMRALDERQMFEKDDEVGDVFGRLVDIVNDLRSLLYGSIDDGTEEEGTR